ncbi:unnamed protein product [Brassicogethes aeneus]|uniref:Uncharacterized protein n=1 Tax=Brassicogethes aeneus TaxID=1431903 RepID=A0A9P0AXD6_BRAAE|nr:unnamed protein product [Brassicogethes aeneus]
MSKLELVKWLKEMGYDGDIPENLDSVCNPATFFIWKQVIQNAINKNTVINMRNNIIIKRLQNKTLDQQDEYNYPILEISAYKKRQDIERNITILTAQIQNKEHQIDALSMENKIKYVTIENLNAKTKENTEKAYLFQMRVKDLEKNISETEENLSSAKSITPTEVNDNLHANEITELLQKCATKLEKHLREIPLEEKSVIMPPKSTIKKNHLKTPGFNSFETFLCKSERKFTENKVTIIKRNVPYDNEDKTIKKVNKALFTDSFSEIKENIPILKVNDFDLVERTPEKNVRGKRESLGILPDDFLNFSDDLNDTIAPLSIIMEQSHLSKQLSDRSHFVSKIKSNDGKNENKISINQSGYSVAKNDLLLKNIINNYEVANSLKEGLHKYDRRLLWSIFCNLNENLITELQKCIISCNDYKRNTINNRIDMAQLYFIHVYIGIHTDKVKKSINEISKNIKNERRKINEHLSSKRVALEKNYELNRVLDLEIKNVGLDATLSTMKQELNKSKHIVYSSLLQSIDKISDLNNIFNIEPKQIGLDSETTKNSLTTTNNEYNYEILIVNKKILSVNEHIMTKLNGIQDFLGHIDKVFNNIKDIKENTNTNVHKLSNFIVDMSWAETLSMNLISEEVNAFEKFPLAYNKQFKYMYKLNGTANFRDISYQNIPSHISLNSDVLYIVSNILETPYSPPETILVNILKSKLKLQALKSINTENHFPKYTEYSKNDLKHQDSENEAALLSKLNHLCNSSRIIKINSAYATIQQIIEIWTKMPLKNFILPSTLVDGKKYKYYEQKFINSLAV